MTEKINGMLESGKRWNIIFAILLFLAHFVFLIIGGDNWKRWLEGRETVLILYGVFCFVVGGGNLGKLIVEKFTGKKDEMVITNISNSTNTNGASNDKS